MSQKLGIGKIVLISLLVSIGFTSAAQPQDNTVVSYIQSGQVVHRTRGPSGGVTDYLPHAGDEILVGFKDKASSTTSDEQFIYLLAPLPTLKFAGAITVFPDGQPETKAKY